MRALALTVLLALCAVTVCAAEPGEEAGEADYLELGALMLRDGNLDRALTALQKVDTEAEEFDSARYRALLGMTHARMGNHSQAVAQLRKAIDAGSGDPLVYVHLAQSSFQIKDYKGVLEALDDAPARLYDLSSVWHMRAQSHWLLKNRAGALAIPQLPAPQGLLPDRSGSLPPRGGARSVVPGALTRIDPRLRRHWQCIAPERPGRSGSGVSRTGTPHGSIEPGRE